MLQQSTPLVPVVDVAPLDVPAWATSRLAVAMSRSTFLMVPLSAAKSVPGAILVDMRGSDSYDVALDVLNSGAEAIVVRQGSSLLEALGSDIVASRVIVSVAEGAAPPVGAVGVLVECAGAPGSMQRYVDAMESKVTGRGVYVQAPFADVTAIQAVAQQGATALVPSSHLSLDSSKIDFVDALLCTIQSDRADGLLPTLVVSETCSAALGLVYSSVESVRASLQTGSAHYQSRKRGLWHKGATSGATQRVVRIRLDCDQDAIEFRVEQHTGERSIGFCHLTDRESCFGSLSGLAKLERTLRERKASAPAGSYTARLFNDPALLSAKIREEAQELVDATERDHIAFEAADLLYFALARCVGAGVGLADIERSLDAKSKKVTRRRGDAKPAFQAPAPVDADAPIRLPVHRLAETSPAEQAVLLRRPAIRTNEVMERVRPILAAIKAQGDAALLSYTAQFDRVELASPVRLPPFQTDAERAALSAPVREAIDVAYGNIRRFHEAQKASANASRAHAQWAPGEDVLEVATMPGVVCTRFPRAIERVGVYVPGGSAVLPSTALMLGVPAQVAGCRTIVLATPPRADGTIAPEVLYVADKVGAACIVCAGGAQAVGAMAYGTASVPKVDKIVGPGNQYVTAAKMLVQNEVDALVSIDMPAGPSEVLVMADEGADPRFVASDLLSQAEHGPDSQVVLVGVALSDAKLRAIEDEVDRQARALPRVDVVRQAIDKSVTMLVQTRDEALDWSNRYAPEHLILHLADPEAAVPLVQHAGSVFVGPWTPESCGDYASGTNHTLPTYGFARQYGGVSTATFQKYITAQTIEADGLRQLGPHVVALAECEGLEAHANAVRVRLQSLS
ncbi:trifunctional histidinol dehydrogenase [Malassezia caprae]|uniref:Histidine biosynthesis trifunctional protein n=1 Tax=Malassezia caprae TaxID=1381934 RepID=A0AAF0E5K5_9BASI|nr:trifunctional histidinol dehydrogenase [Malassezia caprae]